MWCLSEQKYIWCNFICQPWPSTTLLKQTCKWASSWGSWRGLLDLPILAGKMVFHRLVWTKHCNKNRIKTKLICLGVNVGLETEISISSPSGPSIVLMPPIDGNWSSHSTMQRTCQLMGITIWHSLCDNNKHWQNSYIRGGSLEEIYIWNTYMCN
jgi:hypothetical protein